MTSKKPQPPSPRSHSRLMPPPPPRRGESADAYRQRISKEPHMEAKQAFSDAVHQACRVFRDPKRKKELSDLSPRFWVALEDLEQLIRLDFAALHDVFKAASRQLGAPGDFGYGTPCGDALRDLYDAWRKLCAARQSK